MTDLRSAAVQAREALRPFANYACQPPCNCHNCRARDTIAALDSALAAAPAPQPIAMIEADDASRLAYELEKLRHDHWTHWTAQENHIAAVAVRHLRLLAQHNASHSTQQDASAFRDAVLEEAAKRCEALRDEHCAATGDPQADAYACKPDGTDCDFVGAWNDAAAAIRGMKGQP